MKKSGTSNRGPWQALTGADHNATQGNSPQASGKSEATAQALAPGLYLVATPIGHSCDISLRALDVLRGCDAIAAEDTRVTAKLLAIHGITKPMSAYNDHNGERERPRLLARLHQGARLALVSDAGTPLVSDPGYKLVRAAIAEHLPVHAIPGAAAPLAALSLSGLPTDRFLFVGFLPPRSGERRRVLEELKGLRASLIFFESAQRLEETLADMEAVLGPRLACVARELTKLHEEIHRNDLATLAAHYARAGAPRGEITLVVGGALEEAVDDARLNRFLERALEFMPVRAAADLAAESFGLPRKHAYERALELRDGDATG